MRATVDEAVPFVEVVLPEPGKPFGPYVVEMPVGQGGMGAVYRARDAKLGRAVALKVMLPAEASDPESRARFMREARLAAAIEHPGIVRIFEVGEVEGTPYIAMEWIEGKPLRRAKVDRPIELLGTIAETLAHAHEHGVIHRDLKPANVMIDGDGRPRLVDFGIAKRVVGAATFATRDGTVLGTPQYMAPEQELSSAVDARADQYAWGVLGYELITGEKPSRPALAHAALDERHGAVILRALSVVPADRFPSMRDLLAAWRAPEAFEATEKAMATPREDSDSNRTQLGHAKVYVATVIAVACVGLGAAALLLRRGPKVEVVAPALPVATIEDAPVADAAADDASVDDASAEEVDASSPVASVSAKPLAARRVVRALETIQIGGSSYLDREDVLSQLRALRPALERCVLGLDLDGARGAINANVYFRDRDAGATDVKVEENSWTAGPSRGPGARGGWFPPASTKACLTSVLGKLKTTPTNGKKDAYALIMLGLR